MYVGKMPPTPELSTAPKDLRPPGEAMNTIIHPNFRIDATLRPRRWAEAPNKQTRDKDDPDTK